MLVMFISGLSPLFVTSLALADAGSKYAGVGGVATSSSR